MRSPFRQLGSVPQPSRFRSGFLLLLGGVALMAMLFAMVMYFSAVAAMILVGLWILVVVAAWFFLSKEAHNV